MSGLAHAAPAAAGAPAPSVIEPAVEWSFNPWRERRAASAVALACALALPWLLVALGLAGLSALALGAAFAASLAPLLVPVRCRIDADGAAQRGAFGWERRRWDDIRAARPVRGGVLLSPFAEPRTLDRFRALLLPIPRAERSRLEPSIAPLLARHGLGRSA